MALANYFLFLTVLLSCSFHVPSHGLILVQNQTLQSIILESCDKIDNQASCLSNIQSQIKSYDQISILTAALHNALNEARSTIDKIATFNTLSISHREQLAIEDCRELLDFSVTELTWSMSEMHNIRSGLKNIHSDGNIKAWLSAALSNQDTCIEGFEGTDRRLERFIRGSLSQVTQLIGNVLTLYSEMHRQPFKPLGNSSSGMMMSRDHEYEEDGNRDFPKWMTDGDKEIFVSSRNGMHVDSVVALDGSGHYRSIGQAILEAPSHSNRRYVIYVKKGVYLENIDMKKKKTNIMLMGDGIGQTVITGNRNFMQGWTTFRTATVGKFSCDPYFIETRAELITKIPPKYTSFELNSCGKKSANWIGEFKEYFILRLSHSVSGKGFIARDITFRNTAGPQNHQGVALRVDSDQSAFYRCSMEGYQDTLYAHSLRHFYRECTISGTIDYIFGNGAAVLQNCKIFTRDPLPLQKVTITAQGRKDPHQSTGFSIQDSYVYATLPTYLGRPWKMYSRTVFINTYMSSMVQPRGWLEWYGDFGLATLWYGEYRNYGPGASLAGRVTWPGYHTIHDASTASFFTVARFLDGMSWLPSTGVKFTAGLTN